MKKIWAGLILLVVVFISYAPVVRNGFVWDDTALILRDPLIRSWRLIPEGFNHYLFVDATPSDFYRPLQRLTYTIEYALFATHPAPYHLTNIVLHAAAAIALMLFAEALLDAFDCDARRARAIAVIAALIWAIHPVHTAAVVYVSGRADPLAALFGFSGCYLVLRSLVRRGAHASAYLTGAGIAFLGSALSKEGGLLFPLMMVPVLILLKQWRVLIRLSIVAAFVHSITSSAAVNNVGGTLSPSAFAVLRLIVISNFVGCITGKSAGRSPFRIRPQ